MKPNTVVMLGTERGGGEFEAFGLTPDVFYVLYMYNIFIWVFF